MPDYIATARQMADAIRPAALNNKRPAGVVATAPVSIAILTTILQHLETLARLEERGVELLEEAFQKELTRLDWNYFVGAAEVQPVDGDVDRAMLLEGTFDLHSVLRHILGAAK